MKFKCKMKTKLWVGNIVEALQTDILLEKLFNLLSPHLKLSIDHQAFQIKKL